MKTHLTKILIGAALLAASFAAFAAATGCCDCC